MSDNLAKPTQTRCPECQSQDVEICNSRETKHGRRRRRGCLECGERWTTYEIRAEELMELKVYQRLLAQIDTER